MASLAADLQARRIRKKQEQLASKITWEVIQRIELCDTAEKIWDAVLEASRELGSDRVVVHCQYAGSTVLQHTGGLDESEVKSGPTASFRLHGGQDIELSVSLHQGSESVIAADIAFRSLQRLCLASAQRLERLLSVEDALAESRQETEARGQLTSPVPVIGLSGVGSTREALGWLRGALGWGTAPR